MSASWSAVLSHVLPLRCVVCRALSRGSPLAPSPCAPCARQLTASASSIGTAAGLGVTTAFAHRGVAHDAIHRLKFQGAVTLAQPLGRALAAALVDVQPGPTAIVPVPLHWRRRWRRGHNQSVALAKVVAATRPGFQLLRALRKSRATRPQVGLDGRQRRRNVIGAFVVRARHAHRVSGSWVVVDDVVTTGATLRAAQDCPRRAGAAELTLAAVAMVEEPGGSGLGVGQSGDDVVA